MVKMKRPTSGEGFARFASGHREPNLKETEARLIPGWVSSCPRPSISLSSSAAFNGISTRRHGSSVAPRPTIIVQQFLANAAKEDCEKHTIHRQNFQYSSPVISGGGSPEDDASDAASSSLVLSDACAVCKGSLDSIKGVGSLEFGRSRRLQQDSWNQSLRVSSVLLVRR